MLKKPPWQIVIYSSSIINLIQGCSKATDNLYIYIICCSVSSYTTVSLPACFAPAYIHCTSTIHHTCIIHYPVIAMCATVVCLTDVVVILYFCCVCVVKCVATSRTDEIDLDRLSIAYIFSIFM